MHIVEHSRRLDKVRTDHGRKDSMGAHVLQLYPQRFIEPNLKDKAPKYPKCTISIHNPNQTLAVHTYRGELARTVVHQLGDSDVASEGGDRHNVAVIAFQHRRQEGFCRLCLRDGQMRKKAK